MLWLVRLTWFCPVLKCVCKMLSCRKSCSAMVFCVTISVLHDDLNFLAGAYAFIAIERPHEESMIERKQERAVEVEQAMTYVGNLFWYYQGNNWTDGDYGEQVRDIIVVEFSLLLRKWIKMLFSGLCSPVILILLIFSHWE